MGDEADWFIDRCMFPTYPDWDDYGLFDDEGVKCRYCSEAFLHWEETPDGWRLFDEDGEMHNCLVGVADVDDFEDVSG